MSETASNSKIFMARLVVGLIVAFLVAGAVTYGFSAEVRDRVWHDLLERPSHLFRFRFILQPVMAGIAALHDGMADARLGRSPYLWTLLAKSSRLSAAWKKAQYPRRGSSCWGWSWTRSINSSSSRPSIPRKPP